MFVPQEKVLFLEGIQNVSVAMGGYCLSGSLYISGGVGGQFPRNVQ